MSNDSITLTATKREILGKQVRSLRSEGKTPAVIHDHGKKSQHITVEEKELKKAYSVVGYHQPIILDVEGKKYTTLVKEVMFKPATNLVFHGVFQSIKANEVVKTSIPVQLTGEVPAEKASLLVLQSLTEVEVEALPRDLVDSIEVDASTLEAAGDTLTVANLTVPEKVTILTDAEQVIATVEVPKDQIAEADAAAEALAEDAAEGSEDAAAGAPEDASESADNQSSEDSAKSE